MQATRMHGPRSFLDRAGTWLLEKEARHNLILGLAQTLCDAPDVYPTSEMWIVSDDEGSCRAAALITPPQRLVIAEPASEAALDMLLEAVLGSNVPVPGVVGSEPWAGIFARRWAERAGQSTERTMAQGIFSLSSVRHGRAVRGGPRPVTLDDEELLVEWFLAFFREASPAPTIDETTIRASADRRLNRRAGSGAWLWTVDGDPVSMSGFGGPTQNGIRIGPVYTPVEYRGRGYATALVAALSQHHLDTGKAFCFLYTDLSNSTSNSIYRRIGYEQITESSEYRFL